MTKAAAYPLHRSHASSRLRNGAGVAKTVILPEVAQKLLEVSSNLIPFNFRGRGSWGNRVEDRSRQMSGEGSVSTSW
jgi:hypothetical protein